VRLLHEQTPYPGAAFFDISRTLRIIARQDGTTEPKALLLKNPALLFEVHDIPVAGTLPAPESSTVVPVKTRTYRRREAPAEPAGARPAPAMAKTKPDGRRNRPRMVTPEVVLDTIRATVLATGKPPKVSHGVIAHGPLANGRRKWNSVNASMSGWQPKTNLKAFIQANQAVLAPAPADMPSAPESGQADDRLDAWRVFDDAARFILKWGTLPERGKPHHYLAGLPAEKVSLMIRNDEVKNIDALIREGEAAPNCLRDFLLATGLARYKGRGIAPAPAKTVQALRHMPG
jgi:hypothetical protein